MRNRHQEGWVEERGKKRKMFYGHYYVYLVEDGLEKRKHRQVVIGPKSEMRKWEAENKLREIIASAAGTAIAIPSNVSLRWFYENRFRPMREGNWCDATRLGNERDMRLYVLAALGDRCLEQIDRFACQTFINSLAERGLSEWVVARCKTKLWSIFDIALDMDFISKNPMARVDMPVCKPRARAVLSSGDLARLFAAVTHPRDRLILLFGAFGGPRASEVFGLQWGCVQQDYVEIRNTAWSGRLRAWRVKRKASFRRIYIPDVVRKAFNEWREESADSSSDALVFPSPKTGRPMWPGVWLQKRIQPIAKRLGIIVPINFQVLRRSCATRNQAHGSLKDVQTLMGHSSMETTGNFYIMEVPESVVQMVERDVDSVLGGRIN
jgi:integrase